MATYKMKTGDTPERVSARFGTTVLDLYKANKGVYQYRTGTTIRLPGTGKPPTSFTAEKPRKVKVKPGVTDGVPGTMQYGGTGLPGTRKETAAGGGGGTTGLTWEEADARYYSSGAHMEESSWSSTMGDNLGQITREWWDQGYRPERMTTAQANEIGIEENWMRENGYVLIGDTWCLSAQTKYWQQNYGGDGTFDYGDDAKDVPPQPTTKTYTQNTQWRVATG